MKRKTPLFSPILTIGIIIFGLFSLLVFQQEPPVQAQTGACYQLGTGADFMENFNDFGTDFFVDDRPPLDFFGEFEDVVITFGAGHNANSGQTDVFIDAFDEFGGSSQYTNILPNGETQFRAPWFGFFSDHGMFPADFSNIFGFYINISLHNGGTFDVLSVDACPSGVDPEVGVNEITLTVDTTTDSNNFSTQICDEFQPNDCSLRGAISFANGDTSPANYTIEIPDGTYALTIGGRDETQNQTGDLNIQRQMSLIGTGDNVIIDANEIDRAIRVSYENVFDFAVILENLTIQDGLTNDSTPIESRHGGAVRIDTSVASLTIKDSTIKNSTTDEIGGGIWALGPLTITNSTIISNTAWRDGGLNSRTNLVLQESVLLYNSAENGAGAVSIEQTALIENSTIAYNSTEGTHQNTAGGVVVGGPTTLRFNTFVGNTANNLDDRQTFSSIPVLNSTLTANIIDSGEGEASCNSSTSNEFVSGGYNIVSDDSCNLSGTGDMENTDALLRPLRIRYSDKEHFSLDNTSPALNHVPNGAVGCGTDIDVDQDGGNRPIASSCDSGAWENANFSNVPLIDQGYELNITIPNDETYTLGFSATDPNSSQMWVEGVLAWVQPEHGNLDIDSLSVVHPFAREIDYTPDADYVGPDRISVMVSDFENFQDGAFDELFVNFNIIQGNVAPDAQDDGVATNLNQPVLIDVVANDSEPDGDAMTVTGVTIPSSGTAMITGTNQVLYTPALDASGLVTFTYTISDGQLASTATVSVLIAEVIGSVENGTDTMLAVSTTNATTMTVNVEATDVSTDTIFVMNASAPSGDGSFAFGDIQFSIDALQNGQLVEDFTFDNPATFTIIYDDADIASLDEGVLTLVYFDADSGSWLGDGITLVNHDPDTNTIVFSIEHLTEFAVVSTVAVAVDDSFSLNENGVLAADVSVNDTNIALAASAVVVTDVTSGTLALAPDGSFVFTPTEHFDGAVSFTYQWSIDGGASVSDAATVMIEVQNVNRLPIVPDSEYAIGNWQFYNFSVVAPGVLADASDPDGEALTAHLVEVNAGGGEIILNEDGGFVYKSLGNFESIVTFAFTATDGISDTLATVTITVNAAPVSVDDLFTVEEDGVLVVSAENGLFANDYDNDNEELTFDLVADLLDGEIEVAIDGSFVYTPALNYTGDDRLFNYRVYDGTEYSTVSWVTFRVIAVDDLPLAVADAYTTTEDTPLNIDAAAGVLNNDTDIDAGPISATLVDDVASGTLMLNADGSFDYTPADEFSGEVTFTYATAPTGTEAANIATVTITVEDVNDAPVANDDSDLVLMNSTLSVGAPGLLANDTDIEGDNLTASLDTQATNGTATVAADGSFTYEPIAGFVGEDSFVYAISDGTTSTTATVSLLVLRDPSQPLEIPLPNEGWNLFGWPVVGSTLITDGLSSIAGDYTTVYGYDNGWLMHDDTLPPEFDVLNTLDSLEFGAGYWISMTNATTLTVGSGRSLAVGLNNFGPNLTTPPTTYYGYLTGVAPSATLEAWIDGVQCGTGATFAAEDGTTLFGIHVDTAACGSAESIVEFKVDDETVATAAWGSAGATPITNNVPSAVGLASATASTPSPVAILPLLLLMMTTLTIWWRKSEA